VQQLVAKGVYKMLTVGALLWSLQCVVLPALFVLVSMAWVLHNSEQICTPAVGHKKSKSLLGTLQGQSVELTRMQMQLSFFETRVSSLEKRLSLLEKKVSLLETKLLSF